MPNVILTVLEKKCYNSIKFKEKYWLKFKSSKSIGTQRNIKPKIVQIIIIILTFSLIFISLLLPSHSFPIPHCWKETTPTSYDNQTNKP